VSASATGLPIAGAYVVLARSEAPLSALAGSPVAQTDDSGVFDIAAIAPGKYQVTVTKAGFATGQSTLDVAADSTAAIALQLAPSSARPGERTEPEGPPAEPNPPGPGSGP
jgi:hypothetical protein